MDKDIYSFVTKQKEVYESGVGVPVAGNWMWSMYKHINYSMLMKNGQFPIIQTELGEKPKKNIILPILNVAHRTEGFDVKDIELYVNDKDYFHLSFLARKFHANWAIENGLDTFIDEVVEGLDYGFVLVKNVNNKRPEYVDPQMIAFCDQSDIKSGPIGLKHQYSVDQLKDMVKQGWYENEIDMAIFNAQQEKSNSQAGNTKQESPSKSIEVYEVEGVFPESWLKKGDETHDSKLKEGKYTLQTHVVTYLQNSDNTKTGLCLFKGKRKESIFKVLIVSPIFGRAAGRGRVEELFEPQIWTDFNLIHMTNMLREASKVIHITDDKGFTTRNNTKNLTGGEFLIKEQGAEMGQLNTQPVNYQLFDRASQEWEQHARTTGSASDPALGLNPVSGTPLGTTQTVVAQGEGIHEYKRGKIALFIGNEIYTDWVLEYLVADMNKGMEWADELSLDEMQDLADRVMTNSFNKYIKDKILSGETVTEEQMVPLRELFKKEFTKSSKKFLKIVKDEFSKLPLKVKVNVAGKQKDLAKVADKLTNVFRTIFANPQGFIETMKIPGASKAFNEMLEASGLSQMDFSQLPEQTMQPVESPVAPAMPVATQTQ